MMRPGDDIRAFLFDFDGTLTCPGTIDFAGIKAAIGCPADVPILEHIATMPPEPARRAWRVLDAFETRAAAAARPNAGAESLLCWLRARGCPCGILTRNSRASVLRALDNFTRISEPDFQVIVTREDVSRQKPHPEGVHLAARRMGLPVAHLGVVGDYRFDVEAGRRARAVTFFLHNGPIDVAGIAADYHLASLDELRPLIEQAEVMHAC